MWDIVGYSVLLTFRALSLRRSGHVYFVKRLVDFVNSFDCVLPSV